MCFTEHLRFFLWIDNFPSHLLNVPSHYDPLGIRVVQLVSFSCSIFLISNNDCLGFFSVVCFLNLSHLLTHDICPNSENKPMIFGLSPYKCSNWLVVLPVGAILFLTHLHIWTYSYHSIFWASSFSFLFSIISSTPYLITANLLYMTLFSWGVCGVVYSNVIFYFLHDFCNFDWCYPALSQQIYLLASHVTSYFWRTLPSSLAVVTWFLWRNSRNNWCNSLLRQSSTDSQSNSPEIDQLCPQKYFLLDVKLLYKSFS